MVLVVYGWLEELIEKGITQFFITNNSEVESTVGSLLQSRDTQWRAGLKQERMLFSPTPEMRNYIK